VLCCAVWVVVWSWGCLLSIDCVVFGCVSSDRGVVVRPPPLFFSLFLLFFFSFPPLVPQPAATKNFKPGLKPGQFPGQEPSDVGLWTVADVGAWLETLNLAQYREVFADAAVDGAFLYDLVDEDLRNTLGIEHALHRKKILNAVRRLRHTDVGQRQAAAVPTLPMTAGVVPAVAGAAGGVAARAVAPAAGFAPSTAMVPAAPAPAAGAGAGAGAGAMVPAASAGLSVAEDSAAKAAEDAAQARGIKVEDIISLVRHGKNKKVAQALSVLPDRPFDPSIVVAPFVDGFGTQCVLCFNVMYVGAFVAN